MFTKPHVHLNVKDRDSSIAFYERLFGIAPLRTRPDGATFDASDPPLFLVVEVAPRTGINVAHFGILVETTEELEQARVALIERGLSPAQRGAKLWLDDPDDNGWEILVKP
jgi:catechol-2,3-dioxygenase